MKRALCLGLGLVLLAYSLPALTSLRKASPPPERLGYQPSFEVSFFTSLEYRYLLSQLLTYDATFYYGAMVDRPQEAPDFGMIIKYVDSATRLNPYNIDAYYFGQAILTWDAGMVREMNHILQRGVKKRSWDFYPPFFLGFNYAHFLNDYQSGARYLELAAKLNPRMTFLPNLVGRLYYQANKTEQAIEYLKVIYQGTFNDKVRKEIGTRITALETIRFLEDAVKRFERQAGHPPAQLSDLVTGHVLKQIPPDPYGGTFYYDRHDGRVKTDSDMTLQGAKHERH